MRSSDWSSDVCSSDLSERLIRSHWENNYIGSVKALNLIEARLAAAMADPDFPPVVYGGLKREQLHRTGSVILHEHDPARSVASTILLWPGVRAWKAPQTMPRGGNTARGAPSPVRSEERRAREERG